MLPSRARRRITAASAKLLTRYVEFPKKSVANDPIRLGGGVRCSDAFGDLVVYGLSVRMDAPSGVGIGAFLFFVVRIAVNLYRMKKDNSENASEENKTKLG